MQIGTLMQDLVSSQITSHKQVGSGWASNAIGFIHGRPFVQLTGAWEQVQPVADQLVAELDAEDVFAA